MRIKAIQFLGVLLIFSLAFSACKKDNEEDNGGSACADGANFCMVYGGASKSGTATYREINSTRHRISWENQTAASYDQVELDIYGTSTGDYAVDTTYASGTAAFEYYSVSATNQVVSSGVSGTVKITTFDPSGSGISGTFEVTTDNGTKVTAGNFVNIK